MDPRTSRGCGVPPDLGVSVCRTAWMEVGAFVPAEGRNVEDAKTSRFSVGVSSDTFKSSRGIRGCVEFEFE